MENEPVYTYVERVLQTLSHDERARAEGLGLMTGQTLILINKAGYLDQKRWPRKMKDRNKICLLASYLLNFADKEYGKPFALTYKDLHLSDYIDISDFEDGRLVGSF